LQAALRQAEGRKTERTGQSAALIGIGEEVPMLDPKRREFIALVGGGGLLLAAKVKRGGRWRSFDGPDSQARISKTASLP
jgi:hypothetical protein